MIDLYKNSNKDVVSKENILKHLSDYDVFNYFMPNFAIGGIFNSPLREDDNRPSFGVFFSKKYPDTLLFKDLATGEMGDCFIFAQKFMGMNYYDVLEKIIIDFNLDEYFNIKTNYKYCSHRNGVITPKEKIPKFNEHEHNFIGVKTREWNEFDKIYWKGYGIKRRTLELYNVYPISLIFLNDFIINAEQYAYCYIENKDNIIRYKIYQPFSKKLKWINNFLDGTLSGFTQLPETGDLLFIASSLKDGLVLHELGYNFIAPQSEGHLLKESVLNDLKMRFNKIISFYDNDKAGIDFAIRNKELYDIDYITTGDIFNKDISDYYIANKKEETEKMIKIKLHEY